MEADGTQATSVVVPEKGRKMTATKRMTPAAAHKALRRAIGERIAELTVSLIDAPAGSGGRYPRRSGIWSNCWLGPRGL